MKQTTLASFFKKPSTKAPEEPAKQKGPGAEVVGRRLKVWWPADAAWYSGGVASYDGERHAIQYDDGDEEAVDLSKEKFEFLEGTHVAKEVKRETKRPAPSSGLTAEQRADRERKRRKAQDSDDDFVVDDDASISEEEEEEEVFDESDDDDKPKPKKRRVIADDDSDEEMAPVKASPSSVPVSSDKKETRPGTPTPFDARGFHDRYRKRSAPVSADKRESYDLVELTDQKVDSHDSEKKSVLPAGCHTHDVDPKYAFLTTARRDADGRTPDDPLFNARTLKVDWHKEPIQKLTGTQQTWWQVKETHADCVLFYKIGKFYELYHTDADVGVAEAGLVYMKGDQAHAGFPELAYGKYVEALVCHSA